MRYLSATRADVDRVAGVFVTEPVGWHNAELFRRDLAAGRCRLEWSWRAEADNQVVGRALWWGLPDSEYPLALECVYVDESVADRVGVAVGLLEAGLAAINCGKPDNIPGYKLVLAEGWRADSGRRRRRSRGVSRPLDGSGSPTRSSGCGSSGIPQSACRRGPNGSPSAPSPTTTWSAKFSDRLPSAASTSRPAGKSRRGAGA